MVHREIPKIALETKIESLYTRAWFESSQNWQHVGMRIRNTDFHETQVYKNGRLLKVQIQFVK